MRLSALLAHYGYWAILGGAFVEGETIVVLGGFAAHRGMLALPGVVLCAFAGSLAGDQFAYFLGRKFGVRILNYRPKWRGPVERARLELEKRGTFLLVSFRFFYGLRNAVPFVAGLAGIPPRRFVPLNALGALIWAPTITVLGYVFGKAVSRVLEHAKFYEGIAFAVVGVAALVAFIVHRVRAERQRKAESEAPLTGE